LGQPVIVENKPGASTTIGTMAVKNAPADGYTLLFQSDGFFSAKIDIPTAGYEYGDFEVLAPLAQTPYALVMPSSLKIKSMADLAAYAKKAGDVSYASLGVGPNQYTILSNDLAKNLGIKVRMIPYKCGMEALTAVMTGQVDSYFATVSLARAQKDNPKISIVAVTSPSGRSKFLPELKSFKESGIPDMSLMTIYGVAIKAGTPADVKAKLIKAVAAISNSDAMKQARQSLSLEEFTGTNEDYLRETTIMMKTYAEASKRDQADK